MTDVNPYATPDSDVEVATSEEFSELSYWNAKGRIGRMRFIAWSMGLGIAFYLVLLVAFFAFGLGAGVSGFDPASMGESMSVGLVVAMGIIYLVFFVFMFRFTIKRCHDFNTTGWLSLLIIIPLGALVFWFVPGTDGDNRFGLPAPPNSTGVKVLFWGFIAIIPLGIAAAIIVPIIAS